MLAVKWLDKVVDNKTIICVVYDHIAREIHKNELRRKTTEIENANKQYLISREMYYIEAFLIPILVVISVFYKKHS